MKQEILINYDPKKIGAYRVLTREKGLFPVPESLKDQVALVQNRRLFNECVSPDFVENDAYRAWRNKVEAARVTPDRRISQSKEVIRGLNSL